MDTELWTGSGLSISVQPVVKLPAQASLGSSRTHNTRTSPVHPGERAGPDRPLAAPRRAGERELYGFSNRWLVAAVGGRRTGTPLCRGADWSRSPCRRRISRLMWRGSDRRPSASRLSVSLGSPPFPSRCPSRNHGSPVVSAPLSALGWSPPTLICPGRVGTARIGAATLSAKR